MSFVLTEELCPCRLQCQPVQVDPLGSQKYVGQNLTDILRLQLSYRNDSGHCKIMIQSAKSNSRIKSGGKESAAVNSGCLQLRVAEEPSAPWVCAVCNSSLKDALLFICTCYTY